MELLFDILVVIVILYVCIAVFHLNLGIVIFVLIFVIAGYCYTEFSKKEKRNSK